MSVDDGFKIPNLGKEPLPQRLRRYALALGISIGVMGALGALFILVLALALPLMDSEAEDEMIDDVAPPVVEGSLNLRP